MRRRSTPILAVIALLSLFLALPSSPATANDGIARKAAKGALRAVVLRTGTTTRVMPTLSSSVQVAAAADLRAEEGDAARGSDTGAIQVSAGTLGCSRRNTDGNVRVNQDCTYRRQAEEIIKANPANPDNLIAGQNDSRIGFNHCGFDYSFDGGKRWGDGIPPFFQHLNDPASDGVHTVAGGPGTGHTYDAASDPAVAFDSQGNAFYSCVLFDINSNASGIFVTRSPAPAGGSFYNNVPAAGPNYVVAEDNSPAVFHDKEFITADSYASSPFRDNVYVTWTVFNFDPRCASKDNPSGQCSSPIYFSKSTDHGVTWSPPKEISGSAPGLCYFGNILDPQRNPSDCDIDQGSDPIVRPNGDIVVVFNNGNTAPGNPNGQQLAVVSHDGGNTFSPPTKVGDDVIAGEPQCDFGRGPEECVPGAYIRTNDFPRIAVDRSTGTLFTTWQDYRTGEYDIQLSKSTDGGTTWTTAAAPVNPDQGKDHYQPAVDVSPDTHRVAISYYRTDRVPNENSGAVFAPGQPGVQAENSDYSLSGGRDLDVPYEATQISPAFPPPDGIQTGFNGDYSGITVVHDTAHPIWSDTRNAFVSSQGTVHDEDVFTASTGIPAGHGGEHDKH